MFKSSTYAVDRPLFEELGLPTFHDLDCCCEHYVGVITLKSGVKIEVSVLPMPAQFWIFKFKTNEGRKLKVSTGSGTLKEFINCIISIANDMIVVEPDK